MIPHEELWDEDTLPWEDCPDCRVRDADCRVRHPNRCTCQDRRREKQKPARPEPSGHEGSGSESRL